MIKVFVILVILINMTAIGDFSFIRNINERMMLEDLYFAVNKVGAWDELRQGNKTMTGWIAIYLKDRVGINKESFAESLHAMQFIAKYGWDEFVDSYTKQPIPLSQA